jgi:hypothetical protein
VRAVSALALALALLGLAGCGGSDGSDGRSEPTSEEVVTQGPGTGDLLVVGTVSRDGKPVEDAEVWLSLWPDPDDTPVGEAVDTLETDVVHTDGSGRYAVRLDPDHLTSRYFPADHDFLNFELCLWDGGHMAQWSSTVSRVGDRAWRTEGARIGDPVYDMSFDLGRPTVTTTDSLGETATAELSLFDITEDAAVPE